MTVSGATTPGQSGPWNDGNEGVLRVPQSSSITGTSPLDCFVSYQDTRSGVEDVLLFCREAAGAFYHPSRMGNSFYMYALFDFNVTLYSVWLS